MPTLLFVCQRKSFTEASKQKGGINLFNSNLVIYFVLLIIPLHGQSFSFPSPHKSPLRVLDID
jgi:hypothetical protein